MRLVLAALIFIATIISALYVAIWWGIVEPIMTIADAIDNDNVTAGLIAWEVCKFFLKEIFAGLIGFFGFTLAGIVMAHD